MADSLTPAQRSSLMSRIKPRHTGPEKAVRALVRSLGARYRLHVARLPGKPDLVITGQRKAIFVHGCFWHRHGTISCKLARMPKTRKAYWLAKLEGNRRRDARHGLANSGCVGVPVAQYRPRRKQTRAIPWGWSMWSIELFAGAGGLGIGVSRAGFTPAAVVERDRWCCDTIRENQKRLVEPVAHWPEPIEGDIRPLKFHHHRGRIDIVTGGPPCQPFSLGGRHGGNEDDRDMWPQAVRVVRETQPRAFIFENVKGMMRAAFSTYRNYIHLQLQHPGVRKKPKEDWEQHLARLERRHTARAPEYNVLAPEILNAADYGIPQRRERVFFVGFRADLGVEWSFPRPTHSLDALLWSQYRTGEYWERHKVGKQSRATTVKFANLSKALNSRPETKPWVTVRDAISDLPDPEREPARAARIANHKFQAGARSYAGHTGSPFDEPAKTLKAGVHGVPGGENMMVRPDGSLRYFTVRESARLQTFPDDYVFHGSWSEAMRQLGNAVPVELANMIASDVIRALENVPETSN